MIHQAKPEAQAVGKDPASEGRKEKLSIVMPLANESATIEALLSRILEDLNPLDRIYCVVDLASTDQTLSIVTEFSKKEERVRLVWSPENTCVVDAYFTGYRRAYADGAEWILEMDAGFNHDPGQINDFLMAASEGYDFVCGSRFMPGGSHDSPPSRVFLSWFGTLLSRIILKTRMSDMTSGYELFTREAMAKVLQRGVRSKANFFQTEIRFFMHELEWKEIPIRYSNRNVTVGRSAVRESLQILWELRKS